MTKFSGFKSRYTMSKACKWSNAALVHAAETNGSLERVYLEAHAHAKMGCGGSVDALPRGGPAAQRQRPA